MKQLNNLTIKLITTLLLSLTLVISSPLSALAQAPEAPQAPQAPSASPAPESSPAPEASPASQASPAPDPDLSPSPDPFPDPSPSPDPSANSSSTQENNQDSSGTSAENSGNGANSTNDSSSSSAGNTQVDVTNTAQVDNNLNLAATTGDNSASYNTGGASSIITGDALASAIIQTTVNNVQVALSGGNCCGGGASAQNSENGSASTNTASATSNNNTTGDINNDGTIKTEIEALSLTGANQASYNTGGDSEIITGDANLVTTIITDANAVNLGIYEFNVNGNQNGDIILTADPANCVNCGSNVTAENTNNGTDSTNTSTALASSTTVETINNDGDVINNIDLKAISGQNEANFNTRGNNSITTGDANVIANVVNSLNTVVDGIIYTVNIFGNLVGNILLPEQPTTTADCGCCAGDVTAQNSDNGSNSTNTANATSTNTTTTTQTNNATINNNLDLDASTGGNEASFNTAGNSVVDTGDVTVDANVINVANVNVTGPCSDPVYMVFVNDPTGNWQGQIAGAAPGTYFYTTDGLLYVVDESGNLIAVNSGNGANSTNNATASSTNSTTTTITNTGSITNNIDIVANTGDNSASYNTKGTNTIKTGNANIALNVINFINSNFSGRKIVMTVVNVLGSWLGHFVPPGASAPEIAQGGPNTQSDSDPNSQGGSTGGDNSSGSTNSSSSNNSIAQSSPLVNLLGTAFNFAPTSIAAFRTQKIVQDDNSISLPQVFASPQDSSFDWRFLLAIIPLALIMAVLRQKFGTRHQ